jgi:hypothetical protein
MINPIVQAFPTPALRKKREGRGTHCGGDAKEITSLGHPPVQTSGGKKDTSVVQLSNNVNSPW